MSRMFAVLNVSQKSAIHILDTAVRQGVFTRRIEVLCPDGSVAASGDSEEHLPPTVHCWVDEDGHTEEVYLPTKSLHKTTFYKLNEGQSSIPYTRSA